MAKFTDDTTVTVRANDLRVALDAYVTLNEGYETGAMRRLQDALRQARVVTLDDFLTLAVNDVVEGR